MAVVPIVALISSEGERAVVNVSDVQKWLDGGYRYEDEDVAVEDMNKKQLKVACEARELDTTGTKDDLIERLEAGDEDEDDSDEDDSDNEE